MNRELDTNGKPFNLAKYVVDHYNAKTGAYFGAALGLTVSIIVAQEPEHKQMPLEQMMLVSGIFIAKTAAIFSGVGWLNKKYVSPLMDYLGKKMESKIYHLADRLDNFFNRDNPAN